MKRKNKWEELKIGYCFLAICNIAFSLYVLRGMTPIFSSYESNIAAVMVIVGVLFSIVFILPCFERLTVFNAFISDVNIENFDGMSYGEKTLHLSFSMFHFVIKIVGWIMSAITFMAVLFFAFILWLVSGSLFEKGIMGNIYELKGSYEVTKYAAKIYSVVTSVPEMIFNKIVEWERTGYQFIAKYMWEEPEIDDIPLVRKKNEDKETTYEDNINDARQGNAKAQVAVGEYLICYGQEKEGLRWLKKAYLQKEPTAYTAYGNLYMNGNIFEKNEEKALRFYKLGVKGKDSSAMYFLAMYYLKKKQTEEAMNIVIKLLVASANMGEEAAAAQLGELYFEGEKIKKDEKKAFYWLNKSVMESQDYSFVGYYWGRCYLEGIGIEQNERKGVQILINSIESGCSRINEARGLVAECYEKGIGVQRNRRKASEYRIAKQKSEKKFDDLTELIRRDGMPERYE